MKNFQKEILLVVVFILLISCIMIAIQLFDLTQISTSVEIGFLVGLRVIAVLITYSFGKMKIGDLHFWMCIVFIFPVIGLYFFSRLEELVDNKIFKTEESTEDAEEFDKIIERLNKKN